MPAAQLEGDARARPGLNIVLAGLCVTEVVSWGVLYYAFPVLAPDMSAETGWPPELLMTGFSLALIVSAILGVPVGRIIDRIGPRYPMTAGSLCGGVALLILALAQTPTVLFVGWVVAGVSMAGVLYPPAFAALTRWYSGRQRVRALAILTLVAGLASTISLHLLRWLSSRWGGG